MIDIDSQCDQILKQPFVRSIVFVQIEQDIASFIIDSVDICTSVYKVFDHIQITAFYRQHQRRCTSLICLIHIKVILFYKGFDHGKRA